jgi:hypothetical protein
MRARASSPTTTYHPKELTMIFTLLDRVDQDGQSLPFTLPGYKTAYVMVHTHNIRDFNLLIQGRAVLQPISFFGTVGQTAPRTVPDHEDEDEGINEWDTLWQLSYFEYFHLGRHSSSIDVYPLIRARISGIVKKDETGFVTVEMTPA